MTSDSFAGSCLGCHAGPGGSPFRQCKTSNVKRRAISDVPNELQKRSHQLKNKSSASKTERTIPEPQSMIFFWTVAALIVTTAAVFVTPGKESLVDSEVLLLGRPRKAKQAPNTTKQQQTNTKTRGQTEKRPF